MTPTHFLHVPINESLWRAIRERRDTTGETTAEIVESALRDQLDLEGDAAFQASTIGAVLDGVYHGDITVGELRERGDFGLGTFDELDGELVMLDGTVYRMDPRCRAHVVSDEVRSPFATVTRWVTKYSKDLEGLHEMEQLEKRAMDLMPSPNYLYGIRAQGHAADRGAKRRETDPTDPARGGRKRPVHPCARKLFRNLGGLLHTRVSRAHRSLRIPPAFHHERARRRGPCSRLRSRARASGAGRDATAEPRPARLRRLPPCETGCGRSGTGRSREETLKSPWW
jgi:hypothetical protein